MARALSVANFAGFVALAYGGIVLGWGPDYAALAIFNLAMALWTWP